MKPDQENYQTPINPEGKKVVYHHFLLFFPIIIIMFRLTHSLSSPSLSPSPFPLLLPTLSVPPLFTLMLEAPPIPFYLSPSPLLLLALSHVSPPPPSLLAPPPSLPPSLLPPPPPPKLRNDALPILQVLNAQVQ